MQRRHFKNCFNSDTLEYKNLEKVFDYCEKLIEPIDFYVDWLIDGGYYGQGVKSEWFKKELKEGISICFGLDYDGLNVKLEMSDKFFEEHRLIDYPYSSKTVAEFEMNRDCIQEMSKYLLKHWKEIKPGLIKLADVLKKTSLEYKKKKEQERKKEEKEEKAWKKQMEEFEV